MDIKEITETTEAIKLVTARMQAFMDSDVSTRIVMDVKTGNMRDYLDLQGAFFEYAEAMTEWGNLLSLYLPVYNKLIVDSGVMKPYNRKDE
jgi:thymidine phosphorylase